MEMNKENMYATLQSGIQLELGSFLSCCQYA